jgi:predicted signal transduction protein with EAL and GGDEF domain
MLDVDVALVDRAIQNVKRAIEGVYATNAGNFEVTASIGVTIYPSDSEESEILLRHADIAMYEAKENGKSQICYFDVHKHRSMQRKRKTLQELELAIKEQALQLFFQPRISLSDGTSKGAEALLRWFRPDGEIQPADIVHAIRGSPLEWLLDTWVIETLLEQIKVFDALGISGPFSLNVCPSTVENLNFPEHLGALLAKSGVSGRNIEIEILEVASIKSFENTDKILRACKDLGVHFSLDDFGTGYSSLTHFHSLTIDKLKIDQSFIRRFESDDRSRALVKSILAIARTNDRPVIAEGVESRAVAGMLAELGCDYAQGFGISKPMPASEYISWAANWQAKDFLQTAS